MALSPSWSPGLFAQLLSQDSDLLVSSDSSGECHTSLAPDFVTIFFHIMTQEPSESRPAREESPPPGASLVSVIPPSLQTLLPSYIMSLVMGYQIHSNLILGHCSVTADLSAPGLPQ